MVSSSRRKRDRAQTAEQPLRITVCNGKLPVSRKALQRFARRLFRLEKVPAVQRIQVIFGSDRMLHEMNKRYRDRDRPTDVLSFTMEEPDLLGEIYISLDRAKQQARDYGASLGEEVFRLFLHGFLHLLGHDHEKASDQQAMEEKERNYLAFALSGRST